MIKILIAEDDQFLIAAYKAKFKKAGFEIKIVADGEAALVAVPEFQPQLMLLDLMMPKKDGFAVLKELRAQPEYASLPILVASNLGQQEDIDKATKLGATGYIVKSNLSLDEIIEVINKTLSKVGGAPQKAATSSKAATPPATPLPKAA